MSTFSMHHNIKVQRALSIATIGSNTNTDTVTIDTAGFEQLEFIFQSGTVTDGTYNVSLRHADESSFSDAEAVSADETLGAFSFTAADDNASKRVGYIGKKRYVQARLTSTGVSSGGQFGATAILGVPHHAPVADD